MSTSVAVSRVSATAALVELLDTINDVGTCAFAELNRAHFSLARLEESTIPGRGAPPSDRWYRLYEQMANQALGRASLSAGSHFNTLAAGVLYSEVADLELRAGDLGRHSARAEVRAQVAVAVSVGRCVANVFLEAAIRVLAGEAGAATRRGPGRPPARAGRAGKSMGQLLRAQLTAAALAFTQTFLLDSSRQLAPAPKPIPPEPTTPPDDVGACKDVRRVPTDLGAELRATRVEVDLDGLAAAARHGEPRAVEALLRALHRPVLVYCRARMSYGSVVQPEDVVQEVLHAVCDMLPRFDQLTSSPPLMAVVLGIARNKLVDTYRATGRDRSQPVDVLPDSMDTADGPELRALRTVQTTRLRWALDQMPEHHHEIIVLRVALRYSAEEVARLMNTTSGAVRVTQHRAMRRLRDLLTDSLDEVEGGGPPRLDDKSS